MTASDNPAPAPSERARRLVDKLWTAMTDAATAKNNTIFAEAKTRHDAALAELLAYIAALEAA